MAVIPGFIRQTGLPQTSGQRGLPSVKIDDEIGQAISQGAKAATQVGGELLLAQAESEVSTATVNAQLKLANLETELSTMDGLAANEAFASRKDEIYNSSSSIITSKRGRKAFDKSWKMASTKSQISVQNTGAKRKIAQLGGTLVQTLNNLSRGLGVAGINPVTRSFADSAGRAAIDGAIATNVITAQAGEKLYIKLRSDLAKSGLNNIIRTSSLKDLDSLADTMADDKFIKGTDKESMWSTLDSTEKLAMQTKVRASYERHVNTLDKREKDIIAKLVRNQSKQYAARKKQIIAAKRGVTDLEGSVIAAPTITELLTDLEEGLIDPLSYEKLEILINDTDPVGNTDKAVQGFIKKIRTATTPTILNTVITELENAVGITISFEEFVVLEKRALAAKPNTPGELRKTSYSAALKKILNATDFLDKILPGSKIRAVFVQLDFEAKIADGEDAASAFTQALEAFNTRQNVALNSVPKPQLGPEKPLREWNLEDVEESILLTKTKFKGKPDSLGTQILILNSLKAYIKQRDAGQTEASSIDSPNKEKLDAARKGN